MIDDNNPVIGHKTFADGPIGFRHEPLRKDEADAIWAKIQEAERKRAAVMPTDADAVRALWEAQYRLQELGWKRIVYCPKDGTKFECIELGSSGIHVGHYNKVTGSVWIDDSRDGPCPLDAVMFKPIAAQEEK